MTATNPIRVMLVDDHAMFREAIRSLLAAENDFEVVASCSDGGEALRVLGTAAVDVMVMDVSMAGIDGIELARRLNGHTHAPRILALTAFDDPAYVRELLSHGVRGYLLKHAPTEKLKEAIRIVARGDHALDPSIAGQVLNAYLGKKQAALPASEIPITPREREVLVELARGFSQREAAERLGISAKTIETHKANLSAKLGIKSRAELVRYAIERGWLQGP